MIVTELKKSILNYASKGLLCQNVESKIDIDTYLDDVKSYELIKRKDLEDSFEEPYQLPNNWRWVQLGDICGIYGGKRIPAGRSLIDTITDHKYIRVADMGENFVESTNIKYLPNDIYDKIKKYTISKDDLYITVAGTIGKIGYVPDDLDGANLTENANKIVFKNINKEWLMYILKSELVQKQIRNKLTKVGQPKLAIKRIVNIIIPIPVIEEQELIVSKIKKIFSKLDEIIPIEKELSLLNKEFPNKYKKSILMAAISGNLTEQLENESIIETLKNNNLDSYVIKDGLFEIPDNWRWIEFGNLVDFVIGKTPPRADKGYWDNKSNYKWVSISDMKAYGYVEDTKECVSDKAFKDIFKEKISPKGTLIMSFKLTVGRCSILNIDALHNEGIISIFPKINNETLKLYLFNILPFITSYGDTKKAIKGNTLNSKSLKKLLIPLPPLEEQERIIKKLNELFPLCHDIDEIINNS